MGAVVLALFAAGCGGGNGGGSTAAPSATTAAPAPTTNAPMHSDWTVDNAFETLSHLDSKFPFFVQDYYSNRVYTGCGGGNLGSSFSVSAHRFWEYKGKRDFRVVGGKTYGNRYEAEVEWYWKGGKNQTSTVHFVVESGNRGDPKIHRPNVLRIDSFWPPGLRDFC